MSRPMMSVHSAVNEGMSELAELVDAREARIDGLYESIQAAYNQRCVHAYYDDLRTAMRYDRDLAPVATAVNWRWPVDGVEVPTDGGPVGPNVACVESSWILHWLRLDREVEAMEAELRQIEEGIISLFDC